MGVITRLPAKTVQQAGFLPAGGSITLTNSDGSGTFYYLVKTAGEIPTYAEVLAGTLVAVGGTAVKSLSAKSWIWMASATGCDITVTSTGLPALDEAEDQGAIPYWSWLFTAIDQDVTVEGTLLDRYGLAIGAGMGDQEVITNAASVGWRDIYGTSLYSALDYSSIVSAIVRFDGPVRARPGLNFDFTVRGAVGSTDIRLEAGRYAFGRLAGAAGVVRLDAGEAKNGLPDFCLIALTSDATVVVEILDANNKTVAAGTITVATAAAKSAEVLITAGLGSYSSTYKKMLIISMSGGLVFWNRAGTGVPGTGNGVGTPAPTSTNALPLLPGMVLG